MKVFKIDYFQEKQFYNDWFPSMEDIDYNRAYVEDVNKGANTRLFNKTPYVFTKHVDGSFTSVKSGKKVFNEGKVFTEGTNIDKVSG